jgi:hypothetical protein
MNRQRSFPGKAPVLRYDENDGHVQGFDGTDNVQDRAYHKESRFRQYFHPLNCALPEPQWDRQEGTNIGREKGQRQGLIQS